MSNADSMFLDNTKKDLVGGITAVVLLTALLRATPGDNTLDSHLSSFLSENSQAIDRLADAVLSAALAQEITDEVSGTLSELAPRQSGYYDRVTINALLSLYAGETQMKDFCVASDAEFHAMCKEILKKKLMDLVAVALWCRVEAYERGLPALELDLAAIYLACLPLVPVHYRERLDSCEDWVVNAKNHWRESQAVQKGLRLTGGADSGLTKLLSQI